MTTVNNIISVNKITPIDIDTKQLAELVVKKLKENNLTLAAAESCTGGLLSAAITTVPGASLVFWGSFVTYTLDAKERSLGISSALLDEYGAVHRETALAMAEATLEKSGASIAVSITGIAGPDGDGSANPVGAVWVGLAKKNGGVESSAVLHHFEGSREEIRKRAVNAAMEAILAVSPISVPAWE